MQELSTEKTTRKQKERIYLASFFGQKKDPTRQSDLDDGAGRISASSLECLYKPSHWSRLNNYAPKMKKKYIVYASVS